MAGTIGELAHHAAGSPEARAGAARRPTDGAAPGLSGARGWGLPIPPSVRALWRRWGGGAGPGAPDWRRHTRYAIPLVASAVAFGITRGLDHFAVSSAPQLFLGAVMVSVWYGGLGPGLLATLLGVGALAALFPVAGAEPLSMRLAQIIELGVFAAVAVLISSLSTRVRQAQRQAEEALAQRDRVLRLASHDLRNPLTVVRGQLQLLRRQLEREDGPPRERLVNGLAQAYAASEQAVGLVNELVDSTHIASGQPLDLQPRPTDLGELARHVVELHHVVLAAQRQTVTLDVEAGVVGLWDAPRLERVLNNLLSNAVKYSPPESQIRLCVQRRQTTDGVSQAVLRVADAGIGIPAGEEELIFQPYRRASNTRGQVHGTGLGLSGARQIVAQHGGTLRVEPSPGPGATFVLCLPLPSAPAT